MKLIEDLGMQYPTENSKQKARFGLYECEKCIRHFKTLTANVKQNNQKYCRECSNTKHGESHTRLCNIWGKMKDRCNSVTHTSYSHYGGRGISVCDEWLKYENFKDWAMSNGYSDELTIDRINNDKGYEPSNCRWATRKVQARNTRRLQRNNISGYRGVSVNKQNNKWQANIKVNNKQIYLGIFKDKLDAAKAYDKYVIDNNLEHTINGTR